MKKALTTITFLFCMLSINVQAEDVFSGDWELYLVSDHKKQKITLKQKGTSVTGRLENGHMFSGTWNFKTKRLTGYIAARGWHEDPYPFYAFFKGRSTTFLGKRSRLT